MTQPSPPKIVLIGAGSAVFGLSALATVIRSQRLRGSEVWLVDINEPGLETMTQLAELMNRTWGSEMRISSTTQRREALPNADFVVVSVQVGPRKKCGKKTGASRSSTGCGSHTPKTAGPALSPTPLATSR